MVERGLRAAGLKTGRYTSPHLDRIEERVAIDGQPVDSADLRSGRPHDVFDAVDRLRAGSLPGRSLGEGRPTFFEVSTAIAFEIFKRAKVDVAVVEVGLGGRFDATNVADADDHRDHLDRVRSRAASWPHAVGDRLREGRHRQAGRAAGDRPAAGRSRRAHRQGRGARSGRRSSMRMRPTTDRKYPPLTLALAGPASARERGGRGGDPRAMVDARRATSRPTRLSPG